MAGSIFSAPGSLPVEKASPSDWADMVDGFQRSGQRWSLGLASPSYMGLMRFMGMVMRLVPTIFPHNVGLGATRLVCFIFQDCLFINDTFLDWF